MLIYTLLGLCFLAIYLLHSNFRQRAVRKSIEARIKATEKTLEAEKKLKDQASGLVRSTVWLTSLMSFLVAFLVFCLTGATPWKSAVKSQLAFAEATVDRVLKHTGGSTMQFRPDGTVLYTHKLSKDKRSPVTRYTFYWSWSNDNRLCITNRPVRSVYKENCTEVSKRRRLKTVMSFPTFPLDKDQKEWTLVSI